MKYLQRHTSKRKIYTHYTADWLLFKLAQQTKPQSYVVCTAFEYSPPFLLKSLKTQKSHCSFFDKPKAKISKCIGQLMYGKYSDMQEPTPRSHSKPACELGISYLLDNTIFFCKLLGTASTIFPPSPVLLWSTLSSCTKRYATRHVKFSHMKIFALQHQLPLKVKSFRNVCVAKSKTHRLNARITKEDSFPLQV